MSEENEKFSNSETESEDPYANATEAEGSEYEPDEKDMSDEDRNIEPRESKKKEMVQKKEIVKKKIVVQRKRKVPVEEVLNPYNLTELILFERITNGEIYAGPPPADRNCISPSWKAGMQFLYFTENDQEVTNWYICIHCMWTTNCILSKGVSNMSAHLKRKHSNNDYKFSKQQLADALHKTWSLSKKTTLEITPNAFKKLIPLAWYVFNSFIPDSMNNLQLTLTILKLRF